MTMVPSKVRKTVVATVVAGSGALLVLLFLLFGPPQLLAKSDQPSFCVQCHVMESEYDAWAHAGAHRRKMCVDCHLPNGNAGVHYVWKSIDGMKDVALFYSGSVPEKIRLTAHGERVLQENCIRCHEQTVAQIDQQRHCWECHRRIMHTRSGAIQTL
jgi:cytochrome c nitrite reductase small subunit